MRTTATSYCFCHCKDTNSKAIHNATSEILHYLIIVFATAKILIRKQFTTRSRRRSPCSYCFCHCKDTNSKAIHNGKIKRCYRIIIVFATAKILIRKQFTTFAHSHAGTAVLFLPLQRY